MDTKYLSYDEYLNRGGGLQESPFYLLEKRAEAKINMHTFNRLKDVETIPEEVKDCCFELIPMMEEKEGNIASESLGSHSISYKSAIETEQEVADVIKMYLSNTKINSIYVLYRGF